MVGSDPTHMATIAEQADEPDRNMPGALRQPSRGYSGRSSTRACSPIRPPLTCSPVRMKG